MTPATPFLIVLAPFAAVGLAASLCLAWAAWWSVRGTRGLVVAGV